MKRFFLKFLGILLIVLVIFLFSYFDLIKYLSLDFAKENQAKINQYYQENQALTVWLFFGIYVLVTAFSLPGATILTLVSGTVFGFSLGLFLSSFASTLGATLAFLSSRYLLKNFLLNKFNKISKEISREIDKNGIFYLFSLRLIPVFPFFIINLVCGLTNMKVFNFFWVSQLGMILGTATYVNAGKQLSKINSTEDIFSFKLSASFVLLGTFPWLAKKLLEYIKKQKVYQTYLERKPKIFDYNMVVIGAGAAGLVTSYLCTSFRAKVALIEKNKMGGDCLNTGCVPSKALLKSAKIAHYFKNSSQYGLESQNPTLNFKKVMARVHEIISKIEPHDSIKRYTELGVTCFQGKAQIISPWEVKVGTKILTTKNITIATGASSFVPQIESLKKLERIFTSENLWELDYLPKKFLIIGAGPIGCEMAQAFSRLGSKVYLLDKAERILNQEDPECSKIISQKLEQEKIELFLNTELKIFEQNKAFLVNSQKEELTIEFDEVLFATGRKANTRTFGLEELGIKTNPNGTIHTNQYLQTKYPNIYACGDVAGPYQLTHVSAHQAWYCTVNALFGGFKKFKADYSVIPRATYTDPEIATVGLNEQNAKEKKVKYDLTVYKIDDLDRAIADSETEGIVRVLTKPKTDRILGATIVAKDASSLILEFTSAMKNKFGLNKILSTIRPYPSMSEANKYLAGIWKRKQVPLGLLSWLEKYHSWFR